MHVCVWQVHVIMCGVGGEGGRGAGQHFISVLRGNY